MSISRSLNFTVPAQAALHLPWLLTITLTITFAVYTHDDLVVVGDEVLPVGVHVLT